MSGKIVKFGVSKVSNLYELEVQISLQFHFYGSTSMHAIVMRGLLSGEAFISRTAGGGGTLFCTLLSEEDTMRGSSRTFYWILVREESDEQVFEIFKIGSARGASFSKGRRVQCL